MAVRPQRRGRAQERRETEAFFRHRRHGLPASRKKRGRAVAPRGIREGMVNMPRNS